MKLFFGFVFLIFSGFLISQDNTGSKQVEIIAADFLRYREEDNLKLTTLSGNVQLKQEDVYMWCDSAILNKELNTVDAHGHVQINQGSVNVWSSHLFYNGNTKLAKLTGGVKLVNNEMTLNTPVLDYELNNKKAYYLSGGTVVKKETIINSRKGYYFENSDDVYFRDNVVITDPNFNLTSDTLRYQVSLDVFTFYGNTWIENKGSKIYCNNGHYYSKTDIADFGMGTIIYNPPQTLFTDDLYYERYRGFARLNSSFHWIDSSMQAEIFADYGEYYENQELIIATKNPLLINKMDDDSLFLAADTLTSRNYSPTDTSKVFYAYRKVKIYTKDLQGVCDSLFYSFKDSTFQFFYSPVLWNGITQIHGDTIRLQTKNSKPHKLYVRLNSWVLNESDSLFSIYDQIKGKYIYGYFDSSVLKKVNVVQNAESLYFGKNDKGNFEGANHAFCAEMWLYFGDKKLKRITFVNKPEAVYTPIKKLPKDDFKLKGFKWQKERRPNSRKSVAGKWLEK